MKKVMILLAAVFCMTAIQAQEADVYHNSDPLVRNISMNTGLSGNNVKYVVQDKTGFIWFGTDGGLCRFDGYNVLPYYNPEQQFDQNVSALTFSEDGLLVGGSKGIYLFNYETEHFQRIVEQIKSAVNHIEIDSNRNVWISTSGQGIFCYNLTTHECRNYPMKPFKGRVSCTLLDATNQVWALSSRYGGLYRLNKSTDQFELFRLKGEAPMLKGWSMVAYSDGSIFVGTWNQGLYQVFKDGTAKQLLSGDTPKCVRHIHQICNYQNQQLYIGSDDGLVQYEPSTGRWLMLSEVNNPSKSSSERFVYGIAADSENGLWVGTFYGGVNYIPSLLYERRFASYHAKQGALLGNVCSSFTEDYQRHIWIATDDAGLCCYDPATESYLPFPAREALKDMNVHALYPEGTSLWVGTYTNGLLKMNMSTGQMQTYQLDGQESGSSCYYLYRDASHRLWAASLYGANLFDEQQQKFKLVKPLGTLAIDISEDHWGNVWFATMGNGLWCYRKNQTWKQYLPQEGDSTSIGSPVINSLCRGPQEQFYIATDKGLFVYQPSSDSFSRVPVDAITKNFSCVIAAQNELWISSDKGLIKYRPGEPSLLFNRYDGLTANQFLPNAGLMASDGRMYFGTTEGFNAFYPNQVFTNQVPPQVRITSFYLFDKLVEIGSEKLPRSFDRIEKIDLSHDENVFSISFSAMSFVSPAKNLYSYMLEGFDKDWVTTHNHRATYTNLPAGTYTFHVKATNNDGLWSKNVATLIIEVHPPFWWSLPAKIVYLLLIAYFIYWITQSRVKREKRRHQREMDRMAERQEQDMRDARLQFFTMIAHEIRTPVTLIIGPLESLKSQWKQATAHLSESGAMTQTLDVIDRNAQRLLQLVNQLLDFNKVQQKDLQVHFKLQNISKLMHAVAERFQPTLDQNGARLVVEYPADDFAAVVDGEAVTKIISNLMTNAVKYTEDFVRLSCRPLEDGAHFRFEVEDNGLGISKDDKEKIFGAFYQARDNKPGTGIGLNIVKNLVEAHHGRVEVESVVGMGTTFIVTLPINQDGAIIDDVDDKVDDASVAAKTAEKQTDATEPVSPMVAAMREAVKPSLLIVDDDEDMRQFIKTHFENTFNVYTAENGKDALRQLEVYPMSLIICDWMMPVMDGPEFCYHVRRKPEISHLPIVMLTAKTDDSSKAEARNCGADTFIEKPFSMRYLEASVKQLLEMRQLLKSKFSHAPLESIAKIAPSDIDAKFLEKLTHVIEENVASPELNVVFLANKLGMSRSSLFTKIRGLADVTPNEMIQVIKLKKAARLLKEGSYKVSEVSFMLGFSSPSYFAKCFQKQFGVKPAEFMEMDI